MQEPRHLGVGVEQLLANAPKPARAAGPVGNDDEHEPVRLDVDVDAYIPVDYVPYEQAKIDIHRRIAASRELALTIPLVVRLEGNNVAAGKATLAAATPASAAARRDRY